MSNILGIDVSKDKLDLVLLNEKGKFHKVISNDPAGFKTLDQWLISRHIDRVHVCLEATGQYGDEVSEYLYGQGHDVSVVNPARIKRYGESKLHRNKTDKADADLIAEFCLKEKPALWEPLSPDLKHLRALVRRLIDLQANYRQEESRLSSGEKDAWVIQDLSVHAEYLKARIQATEEEIQNFIKGTPGLKANQDLLVSIPGVGKKTSARLMAEIGDISRFENAPQLAAYAGLNPKGFSSGSSVHKKTRISKQGRSELRACLYMPAIVAMTHNPVVRALKERLQKRQLPTMAIVVACMRKLLHIVYGVLKSQRPFDPDYDRQFNYSA
jgi:transposase